MSRESDLGHDPRAALPALKGPRYAQSLDRGLAVLRCFTPEHHTLGVADVADRIGLSRSTTHRYMSTLLELGYFEQNMDRKYRLAPHATRLGMSAIAATGLREAAYPYLEQLSLDTGCSVGLGVLLGAEVVYLEHLRGWYFRRHVGGPRIGIGVHVPAPSTAIGMLLIALAFSADREKIVTEYCSETEQPRFQVKCLGQRLAMIASLGYAVSMEARDPTIRSLAVPVYGKSGVAGAVNLFVHGDGPPTEVLIDDLYPLVRAGAEDISQIIELESGVNRDSFIEARRVDMPSPSPSNAYLGRAIRELRHERKMTIDVLAKAAGSHITYVSGIERGRRNPSWEKINRIADALGSTMAEIARNAEEIKQEMEDVASDAEQVEREVASTSEASQSQDEQ
jgi:IclR family transcriptional regulator, pca regulon regulatory protein